MKFLNNAQKEVHIRNEVIWDIHWAEALGVWLYLLIEPYYEGDLKNHLKQRFNVGTTKIQRILRYLMDKNLIRYSQRRDKHARFTSPTIHILNGDDYIFDKKD